MLEMGYCKEFTHPTKPNFVCSGFVRRGKLGLFECRNCNGYKKIDPEKPLPIESMRRRVNNET